MSLSDSTAVMDRIYRHQRHIYDPTRKYFLLGRDRLIERLQPGDGATVLEIGCGTGRNLIEMARRYPDTRLFGLDISTEMLTSAIAAIDHAGLSAQVRVTHADAGAFDPAMLFGVHRFERIVLSYGLSMMPHWPGVLRHSATLLAPRDELHVVDFGGQEGLPRWFRRALRRWLALFSVTPRDRLESVLREVAAPMGAGLMIERPYRGYAQYAILRRPVDGFSAGEAAEARVRGRKAASLPGL